MDSSGEGPLLKEGKGFVIVIFTLGHILHSQQQAAKTVGKTPPKNSKLAPEKSYSISHICAHAHTHTHTPLTKCNKEKETSFLYKPSELY